MMSNGSPNALSANIRGIFFLLIGLALLIHTIMPSQYLSTLVVVCGALAMVVYGGMLLNLHVTLGNWLGKLENK